MLAVGLGLGLGLGCYVNKLIVLSPKFELSKQKGNLVVPKYKVVIIYTKFLLEKT